MIQVFLLNMLRVKRRTVPFTNNNYLGSPFSSENKIDFVLARVKLEAGTEIEKIILESGLTTKQTTTEEPISTTMPIQTEGEPTEQTIQGGMKKYTKKEILKLINNNLNKLNKNKLIYIYSQTLNH